MLELAVKQINKNPEGSGFRVRMKLQKEGRAIKWVVFEVIKTKERQAIDEKLRIHEKRLSLFDVRLRLETYEEARKHVPGWDIYTLEIEWCEWGARRHGRPPDKPDAAFIGFCKQQGAYAG